MGNANGLQPGMIHPQHIHAAAQCPPASADVNGDGFVDQRDEVFVPLCWPGRVGRGATTGRCGVARAKHLVD